MVRERLAGWGLVLVMTALTLLWWPTPPATHPPACMLAGWWTQQHASHYTPRHFTTATALGVVAHATASTAKLVRQRPSR